MINSPDADSAFAKEKTTSLREKVKETVSRIFVNHQEVIEPDAFTQPWNDDMCLALKTEIESKPEGIDVDKLITSAYERLINLLGPHNREDVSLKNIKNRVIFTDPNTLTAFMHLFGQPGEDSDKFWQNPIKRMLKTRSVDEVINIVSTNAVSYKSMGVVMIPNEKEMLKYQEDLSLQYIEQHGINQSEYPELVFKRLIAHELTHYLYSKLLSPHSLLNEPITDYIATIVFPEIKGININLDWAKASVEDYMKRLGYESVKQLVQPNQDKSKEKFFSVAAATTHKKYFSKLEYKLFGYPEETINDVYNTSKFSPIPE